MPKRKISRIKAKPRSNNLWVKIISVVAVLVTIILAFFFIRPQKTEVFQIVENPYPFGQALKLNGSPTDPQYVTLDHNPAQVLTDNFTIEAWIKPELPPLNVPTTYVVFQKNINGTADSKLYGFSIDATQRDNTPRVSVQYIFSVLGSSCISNNSLQWNSSNVSLSNFSKWNHIAVVKKADKMYLFENGVLLQSAGSVSTTPANCDTNSPLIIGAKLNTDGTPSSFFKGLIDDFRISNTARYSTSFPLFMSPFTVDQSTIGLYNLNANLRDSSSNLMNGKPNGSISYVNSDVVKYTQPSPTPTVPACYWQVPKCLKSPCPPRRYICPSPKPSVKPSPTPRPSPRACQLVNGTCISTVGNCISYNNSCAYQDNCLQPYVPCSTP